LLALLGATLGGTARLPTLPTLDILPGLLPPDLQLSPLTLVAMVDTLCLLPFEYRVNALVLVAALLVDDRQLPAELPLLPLTLTLRAEYAYTELAAEPGTVPPPIRPEWPE
jgi:hypothetical protein